MKLVVDMNLSPRWAEVLRRAGFDATHWSALGDPGARDETIIAHARNSGAVVLTHDLDFGLLLAIYFAAIRCCPD